MAAVPVRKFGPAKSLLIEKDQLNAQSRLDWAICFKYNHLKPCLGVGIRLHEEFLAKPH